MPRTPRTLETPGAPAAAPAAPAAPDAPNPDAFQATGTELGGDPEPVDPTDLAAIVAKQAKQIELMMAAMQQMQANAGKPVASMPVVEKHPTLEELGDLSKITVPTMTDKGLYVPPTYGSNPAVNKG